MAHSHDDHADGYHVHAHVSTTKFNLAILGALLFLTLVTVGAYNIRLGDWNLFVAIVVATMKAGLVMGFYMHLHWEKGFNKLFFLGSFLFVAIFLGYTVNDTSHRGRQQSLSGLRVDPATGQYAHGTAALITEHGPFQPLRPVEAAAATPAASDEGEVEASAAAGADEAVEAEAGEIEAEGVDVEGAEAEGVDADVAEANVADEADEAAADDLPEE
ncbi:MAG: cytochrome C oxidase subunit IV family protein [Myxococcales bacterium]|nr:cytochrome C oxidase subunit IV family protein [Myxococcales bacterium]